MSLHKNEKVITTIVILLVIVTLGSYFYFFIYEPTSHVYLKADSLNEKPSELRQLTDQDMRDHPDLWTAINRSGAKIEISWDEYHEYITFLGTNNLKVSFEGKYYNVWVLTAI